MTEVSAQMPEAAGATVVVGNVAGGPVTSAIKTDDNSDHALQADAARSTFHLTGGVTSTGATIRIGILSDSFNATGGAATDEANGDLPSAANVHILQDYGSGEDEGRAMADLVHRIAPGAQIYFYSGDVGGQAGMAQGITTLAQDGCQIIVDDISYFQEPFYQADGLIQRAVDTVTAAGVTYFTSVTNNGDSYYESNWSNIANYSLYGVGTVNVHNIGNNSPYEAVTINSGNRVNFELQWQGAFKTLGGAGDTFNLGMALYDLDAGTLVQVFKPDNAVGGDPTLTASYTNDSGDTDFAVAWFEYGGSVLPFGAFKTILGQGAATFTGPGAGVGSGASFGHNAAPDANPTAAVDYRNTPAFGVNPAVVETFSSEGGTTLYYDAAGNRLATPVVLHDPYFSATDGDATSLPANGGLNPFYGTSAAAPNAAAVAALVLAEDGYLTHVQITYLLGATASAFGNSLYTGDGLINAYSAVAAASTAVGNPIWTGLGGSALWSTGTNWSDQTAPSASTNVIIGNGIGLYAAPYTVVDNLASSAANALLIDGLGSVLYALSAFATPTLQVTAGSVLTAASITVGLGELDVFGRVTDQTNFGLSQTITGPQALIEAGGVLEIGGNDTVQIQFVGRTGTLLLDTTAPTTAITGAVVGFSGSDRIDLSHLTYSASNKVAVTGSAVTVTSAGGTVLASLTFGGTVPALRQVSDGAGGTAIIGIKAITAEDFNGDGKSDVVLQNTNGTIVIESQSNLAITGGVSLGSPGATWHVVGTADYNGDGQADILLQNDNSQIVDYLMNGTAIASASYLGQPGAGWHVRGNGDFNGDGRADIVLQNDNSQIVVWTTNGSTVTGAAAVVAPGAGWTVEGVADFNGDGQSDILVQNTNGALVDYLMNGSTVASANYLGNPGAGWTAIGTGDYNGDGKSDILLHNDNGADVIWDTNGTAVTGAVYAGNPGASYTGAVAGVDLNGDGSADLVIQNTSSTLVGYTLNNAAQITAGAVLGTPGAGWSAIGNDPVQFLDGTGSAAGATIAATAGSDQFNFTAFVAGPHYVAGFDAAQDTVALSAATFASFAAVQANEVAYNGGTFINLTPGTGGGALVIQGVTPDKLSASNFVLR